MKPNRAKHAGSKESAANIVETFKARPYHTATEYNFNWPTQMQEVGRGCAVMYRSNKWKHNPREWEEYKHIAESDQTVYVTPGFLRDFDRPTKKIPVHGPMVTVGRPMPDHIGVLAPLLGVQLQLFGSDGEIHDDDDIYEVRVKHALLGAARHPESNEPFLVVYTKSAGVHMILTGDELDIEKDGIVG